MTQEHVEIPIDVDLTPFQQGMDTFRAQMQASEQLAVTVSSGLDEVTSTIAELNQVPSGGLITHLVSTSDSLRPIATITNQATASLNSLSTGQIVTGVDQLSTSLGAVSSTTTNLMFNLNATTRALRGTAIAAKALSFLPGQFGVIATSAGLVADGTSKVSVGLGLIGGMAANVSIGLGLLLAPLRGLVIIPKMIAAAFSLMFTVILAPFKLLFSAVSLVVKGMMALLKPVLAVSMAFFRLKIMLSTFRLQFVILGKLLSLMPPKIRLLVGGLALLGVTGRAGAAAMKLLSLAMVPVAAAMRVASIAALALKGNVVAALSLTASSLGQVALSAALATRSLLRMVTSGIASGIRAIGRAAVSVTKSIGGGLVGAITSAIKWGAGLLAIGAGWGVKLAADAEQAQVAFATMLKSGDAAKAVLNELEQFAASTPFQLNDLRDGAKQLLNAQVPATELTNRLRMLGDIAAGTGKPINDFVRIFAKVKSTGKVSLETLNQLAERGVPIYGALGSQLGKSRTEMLKMIGSGKVGFNDLEAALNATATGAGVFAGGMAAQSQTVTGLFSTLKDNVGFAMRELGNEIIAAFNFKSLMADGITMFQSLKTGIASARPLFQMWANGVKAAFGAVWEVVSVTFNAITSALGITGGNWMESFATWAAVASFAFKNWPGLAELAFTKVGLFLAQMGAEFVHYFTVRVPTVLRWFYDNFTDIFSTAASFVGNVFKNIGSNIANAMTAIWAFIKSGGTSELELAWTPLLDGFESTVKKLPDIPERAIGELERSLAAESERLGAALSSGLADEIAGNLQMLADFKTQQANIETPTLDGIESPEPTGAEDTNTTKERTSFIVDSLNKGSVEALKAVFNSQNKTPEKQLTEAKKTNGHLKDLPAKIAKAMPAQFPIQEAVGA